MSGLEKYKGIINLPHHVSKIRPQMPMSDRAAQFAPFAALTGYDSAIKEEGRLTDKRIDLDEESLLLLDRKLNVIKKRINEMPQVSFEFFLPDERKAGGKYSTVTGIVKRIDEIERSVVLIDGTKISVDDITKIML